VVGVSWRPEPDSSETAQRVNRNGDISPTVIISYPLWRLESPSSERRVSSALGVARPRSCLPKSKGAYRSHASGPETQGAWPAIASFDTPGAVLFDRGQGTAYTRRGRGLHTRPCKEAPFGDGNVSDGLAESETMEGRQIVSERLSSVLRSAWVPLVYVLLTLVMTYPAVLNLSEQVLGRGEDVSIAWWNNWWVRNALSAGENVYFTRHLFSPQGADLTFHSFWTTSLRNPRFRCSSVMANSQSH